MFSIPFSFRFPSFFYPASSPNCALSLACNPPAPPSSPLQNRSPTLCSSLSLLFSGSSLVPRAGICCFRVSHTAVMRIVFPQVVFGVPVITPLSLWIPRVLFPWGLASKSRGLLFVAVSTLPAFSLDGLFLRRERTYSQPTQLTYLLLSPFPCLCTSLPLPFCLTLQHRPCRLPVICHFSLSFSSLWPSGDCLSPHLPYCASSSGLPFLATLVACLLHISVFPAYAPISFPFLSSSLCDLPPRHVAC